MKLPFTLPIARRALIGILLLTFFGLAYSDAQGIRQTLVAPLNFALLKLKLSHRDEVHVSGTYVVTSPIRLRTGQRIYGNATFITEDTAFIAEGVHSWQLEGITIRGRDAGNRTGTGLWIKAAVNRYKVTNVTFEALETGIFIDPPIEPVHMTAHDALYPYVRGDQGQFVNVALYDNVIGLRIDTDTFGEYNIFTNLMAANNDLALKVGAGNNIFSGFSIADNKSGVWLTGDSPSHAHGVFSGGNINHNIEFNVKVTDVAQGQTFSGVYIYGDDETKGRIIIENSQGIRFDAGVISAVVENNKGAGTSNGLNVVSNNLFDGKLPAKAGNDRSNLLFKDNTTAKR
jgi:hypothetical protein